MVVTLRVNNTQIFCPRITQQIAFLWYFHVVSFSTMDPKQTLLFN